MPRRVKRLLNVRPRWSPGTTLDESTVVEAVRAAPPEATHVLLTLDSPQALRALALPSSQSPRVRALTVTIEGWTAPIPGWSGRTGWVPRLTESFARYPATRRGTAQVGLAVATPVRLSTLAAAAYPALAVAHTTSGTSNPRLVVDGDVPAGVLAMMPDPVPDRFRRKPSSHLQGVGLAEAEVALVATEEGAERAIDPASSEETWSRDALVTSRSGFVFRPGGAERPLLDMHVHNPHGRMQNFHVPKWHASIAATTSDRVTLELSRGSTSRLLDIPLGVPLRAADKADLSQVEHLSLEPLGATGESASPHLTARMIELAATGLVLHSAPPVLNFEASGMAQSLSALIVEPYTATMGLARDLRSVPQRRSALMEHGGFWELAATVERRTGHRMAPTVSLLMSSLRPERALEAIAMFARQSYPHIELVLAMHGSSLSPELLLDAAGNLPLTFFEAPLTQTFGEVLGEAARRSSGDLVVKVDDDDLYGEHFVSDLVLAHYYSSAAAVGKTTEYLYFEDFDHTIHRRFAQETYHTQVAGGALLMSRAVLDSIGGWRPTPNSTDRTILIGIARQGGASYRTNGLDYTYVRHADGHTWARSDEQLLRGAFEQWPGKQPRIISREGT